MKKDIYLGGVLYKKGCSAPSRGPKDRTSSLLFHGKHPFRRVAFCSRCKQVLKLTHFTFCYLWICLLMLLLVNLQWQRYPTGLMGILNIILTYRHQQTFVLLNVTDIIQIFLLFSINIQLCWYSIQFNMSSELWEAKI